jgi:hypothetical protein
MRPPVSPARDDALFHVRPPWSTSFLPFACSKCKCTERQRNCTFFSLVLFFLHVVVSNICAHFERKTKEGHALQDTKRNQTAEACFLCRRRGLLCETIRLTDRLTALFVWAEMPGLLKGAAFVHRSKVVNATKKENEKKC